MIQFVSSYKFILEGDKNALLSGKLCGVEMVFPSSDQNSAMIPIVGRIVPESLFTYFRL